MYYCTGIFTSTGTAMYGVWSYARYMLLLVMMTFDFHHHRHINTPKKNNILLIWGIPLIVSLLECLCMFLVVANRKFPFLSRFIFIVRLIHRFNSTLYYQYWVSHFLVFAHLSSVSTTEPSLSSFTHHHGHRSRHINTPKKKCTVCTVKDQVEWK